MAPMIGGNFFSGAPKYHGRFLKAKLFTREKLDLVPLQRGICKIPLSFARSLSKKRKQQKKKTKKKYSNFRPTNCLGTYITRQHTKVIKTLLYRNKQCRKHIWAFLVTNFRELDIFVNR
jgi:hypothetical protein